MSILTIAMYGGRTGGKKSACRGIDGRCNKKWIVRGNIDIKVIL
jgi:hypothetical protein